MELGKEKNDTSQEEGKSSRSTGQGIPIQDLLKEGQEIVVQIAKNPLGTKGARITSFITLAGRHIVYMPTIYGGN